jgi:dolichyl-phosphate beta-glucosyltransferase
MERDKRQSSQPPDPAPWLTVVIPAYNEERRIREPLAAVCAYLGAQSYEAEIVVVDDGSSDGTFAAVRETAAPWDLRVRVVRYRPNRGKGHAVKTGIALARGERILMTDADLSTPIEEAGRLLAGLDAGADVVIGTRKTPGADIRVRQPWYRERLGRAFTWIVRHSIADVSDVTCGFKAFRRQAAKEIFGRVRIPDWTFDAEAMMLVAYLGYRLEEVTVRWDDRAGTKVRVVRDVIRSLRGLVRIRTNAARGLYRTAVPALPAGEVWDSRAERRAAAGTPAR